MMADAAAGAAVAVDLTATQFVILSENQRKKAALASSKEACSALQAENRALLQQLEDSTQEAYQVSEHFRQELLAKNARIGQLQQQCEQLQAQGAEREAQLQQQAAAQAADTRDQFEALSTEMMERIEQLQDEVQGLQEFKQHKAEFEAALAALREEAVGLREALDAQRMQLERHYAGLNAKMRKEYEQKLEELKRTQEEELEGQLDAGVKRILAANRRMAEEMRLHITESDALQSQVALLTAERARLSRELSLKVEMEAGLALRAGQQSAALKEAHAKVAALEQSLQQVLSDFAAERASVVAAAGAQVQAAASEVGALRRLLRLKGRELGQLRALAQEVLLQRSKVEVFLLSSLHQVCLAIDHERKAGVEAGQSSSSGDEMQAAEAGCSSSSGSGDASGGGATVDAAAGSREASGQSLQQQLDIRDLSWSDRERVLRLLFAKVNGRAAEAAAAHKAAGGSESRGVHQGS